MANKRTITIQPKTLRGSILNPPSKSISHRGIICAGLSPEPSTVSNLIYSVDIKTTIEVLKQLGMVIHDEKVMANGRYRITVSNPKMKTYYETGEKPVKSPLTVECNESGSTIRFLMPFFNLSQAPMTFVGKGRLNERPYDVFYRLFESKGIKVETTEGKLPVTLSGEMKSGHYPIEGNVSSQFISGLLMLLPLLDGDSVIDITTHLESKGYVDLTLDALKHYGIDIKASENQFEIKGNQDYKGKDMAVEGDYSQVAFWLVGKCLGNPLLVTGVNENSNQGDRAIIDIIESMGAQVTFLENDIFIQQESSGLKAVTVDASQCPDLVPVLAVLLSMAEGKSQIINAERLRFKESDRLKAICTELNKLGGKISETPDGLIIEGIESFTGGTVSSWNDHRIAMALAIAATKASGPVTISGAEAVNKSYPMFWEDYQSVGGVISE